jgi:RNA polymerase sigma-70 factor (ECF subfamily)
MNIWPDTNPSLIEQAKCLHDPQAWEQLVSIYQPVLYRIARGQGLSHDHAEDSVQNIFLALAKSIARWETKDQGPRFRSWLGRIARNTILNALTRSKPDRAKGTTSEFEILKNLADNESRRDSRDDSIIRDQIRLEVIRMAASQIQCHFNQKTWQIFQDLTVDGQNPQQVALSHGCSVGAVYAARCRVISKLRQKAFEYAYLWED